MCERFETPRALPWTIEQWTFLAWEMVLVSGENTQPAATWLHDPDLPGRWDFQRDQDPDSMYYRFYIEDADVAFAFKMRWG